MRVIVFGRVSDNLKRVAEIYSLHKFCFVEEVNSLSMNQMNELVIQGGVNISKFDGVILLDTDAVYNYIWSENLDIPWFSEPFSLKNGRNHNYYFSKAVAVRFLIPNTKPTFDNGKVSVVRDYPKGTLNRFFIFGGELHRVSGNVNLSGGMLRKIKAFIKLLNLSFGVITFLQSRDDLYFQSFTPIPDFGEIDNSVISRFLDRILFQVHLISNRS